MRLLLAAAALLLATACGSSLTPAAVSTSFAGTFAGLYAAQQGQTGRTDVSRKDLAPIASCRRTGTSVAGPGEDWTCTVQYVDAGQPLAQSFEVQLKADGCWKADGPPARQPAQILDSLGMPRTNPLAEFDGCIDTSWR